MSTGATALPLPNGIAAELTCAKQLLGQGDQRSDDTVFAQGKATTLLESSWPGGTAATAARTEAGKLGTTITTTSQRLVSAGDALQPVETALTTAMTNITKLQHDWDEAEATYRRHLDVINHDPEYRRMPQDEKQSAADGYAAERTTKQEELKRSYAREMTTLRTAADSAATTLDSLSQETVPHSHGTTPQDAAAYVLKDLPLAQGELRQSVAELEAKDLKGELDRELAKPSDQVDVQHLDQLQQQYAAKMSDPYFAAAFMRAEKPEDLERTIGRLMDVLPDRGGSEQAGRWATSFGVAFNTAAGGKDADLDEFSRVELQQWRTGKDGWLSQLEQYGRSERSVWGDGTLHGERKFDGYWMISQLMAAGKAGGVAPGTPVLTRLGTDILAWDRDRFKTDPPHRLEDFRHDGLYDAHSPEPLALTGRPGQSDDSPSYEDARDPVWSVLYAAEGDHAATKDMLLAKTGADGNDPEQNNLKWLIEQRRKTFDPTMETHGPFQDGGLQLSRTVVNAGTDVPPFKDPRSAELAGTFVNSYGQAITDGRGDDPHGGTNAVSRNLIGMRDSVGTLLAMDPEAMVAAATNPDETFTRPFGDRPGAPGGHGIHIQRPHQLAAIFAELALDRPDDIAKDNVPPTALRRVIDATMDYGADPTQSQDVHGHWTAGNSNLQAERTSRLLSYVTTSATAAQIAQGEGIDADNQRIHDYTDKLVDLVAKGWKPAGHATKVIDPLMDYLLPLDHADKASEHGLTTSEAIQRMNDQRREAAVIKAEPWHQGGAVESSPEYWMEHGKGKDLGPQAVFYRNGTIIPFAQMTPEQMDAFRSWKHDKNGGADYFDVPKQSGEHGTMVGFDDGLRDYKDYNKDLKHDPRR